MLDDTATERITITKLCTGYWHARGVGPTEWAQWPVGEPLTDDAFFVQASAAFRRALRDALKEVTLLPYVREEDNVDARREWG